MRTGDAHAGPVGDPEAAHPPTSSDGAPAQTAGVPAWVPATGLLLALAGLGASAYLTVAHYTAAVTLACPDTGAVDCAKVTSSAESALLGVPVALLGLLYFAGMLVGQLPVAWRSRHPLLRTGRLVAAAAGVAMVLWLVYAELFRIGAICLWCTVVHVLTVALFALTAVGTALAASGADD